jgi:hypothetical protein
MENMKAEEFCLREHSECGDYVFLLEDWDLEDACERDCGRKAAWTVFFDEGPIVTYTERFCSGCVAETLRDSDTDVQCLVSGKVN